MNEVVDKVLLTLKGNNTEKKVEAIQRLEYDLLEETPLEPQEINQLMPALRDALKGSQQQVSYAALICLNQFVSLISETHPTYLKNIIITFVAAVIDKLGDNREKARDAASNILLTMWELATANGSNVITTIIIKEIAFEHEQWRVREQILQLIVSCTRRLSDFPIKQCVPYMVKLLEDPHEQVRETAKDRIVLLFSGVAAHAKSDLRREIEKQTIRPAIAEYILSKMNINNSETNDVDTPDRGEKILKNLEPAVKKKLNRDRPRNMSMIPSSTSTSTSTSTLSKRLTTPASRVPTVIEQLENSDWNIRIRGLLNLAESVVMRSLKPSPTNNFKKVDEELGPILLNMLNDPNPKVIENFLDPSIIIELAKVIRLENLIPRLLIASNDSKSEQSIIVQNLLPEVKNAIGGEQALAGLNKCLSLFSPKKSSVGSGYTLPQKRKILNGLLLWLNEIIEPKLAMVENEQELTGYLGDPDKYKLLTSRLIPIVNNIKETSENYQPLRTLLINLHKLNPDAFETILFSFESKIVDLVGDMAGREESEEEVLAEEQAQLMEKQEREWEQQQLGRRMYEEQVIAERKNHLALLQQQQQEQLERQRERELKKQRERELQEQREREIQSQKERELQQQRLRELQQQRQERELQKKKERELQKQRESELQQQHLNKDWRQIIKNLEIDEIPYENFGKKKRIGYGGSGLVFKTTCESRGIVAIKEVNMMDDDKICTKLTKLFINELKILSHVDNERIIQFYGVSRNVDERLYYIVLEHANQGNLREFIKKNNSIFEWEIRIRLATQIAEGLHYLHEELNIAHRDLHTKNILMHDGNVKISDFGLSKNLNSTMTNNGTIGIIPFIDRQKLINEKFVLDKRSDIYSLGMLLWEISSCCTPFLKEDSVLLALKICQGLQEKPVKGTPMDYIKLYTNCWILEPDSRPLIHQVLSQLQIMLIEPVFDEGHNEDLEGILPPDTLKNSISGYSNQISLK